MDASTLRLIRDTRLSSDLQGYRKDVATPGGCGNVGWLQKGQNDKTRLKATNNRDTTEFVLKTTHMIRKCKHTVNWNLM